MLKILLFVLLAAQPSDPGISRYPAFAKELERARDMVKKTDPDLSAAAEVVREGREGFARVCIRDKRQPHLDCVFHHRAPLLKANAAVLVKLVAFGYGRVHDDTFGGCAHVVAVTAEKGKAKKTDETLCRIGDRVTSVIFAGKDDPERDVTARITCIGDSCPRKR